MMSSEQNIVVHSANICSCTFCGNLQGMKCVRGTSCRHSLAVGERWTPIFQANGGWIFCQYGERKNWNNPFKHYFVHAYSCSGKRKAHHLLQEHCFHSFQEWVHSWSRSSWVPIIPTQTCKMTSGTAFDITRRIMTIPRAFTTQHLDHLCISSKSVPGYSWSKREEWRLSKCNYSDHNMLLLADWDNSLWRGVISFHCLGKGALSHSCHVGQALAAFIANHSAGNRHNKGINPCAHSSLLCQFFCEFCRITSLQHLAWDVHNASKIACVVSSKSRISQKPFLLSYYRGYSFLTYCFLMWSGFPPSYWHQHVRYIHIQWSVQDSAHVTRQHRTEAGNSQNPLVLIRTSNTIIAGTMCWTQRFCE